MKIKVSDIEANPFRNIDEYTLEEKKLQALERSINVTGFWDNVVVRPKGKKYELAYGHHRLEVLNRLSIEEVDIPVKDLSDETMLKMMVCENQNEYGRSARNDIHAVEETQKYLDAELAKYETWDELEKKGLINLLDLFLGIIDKKTGKEMNPKMIFGQNKTKGVGQTTILKFLGDIMKQHQIQKALAAIKDEEMDTGALMILGTTSDANEFRKAVKEINKEKPESISVSGQLELAERVKERINEKKSDGGLGSSNMANKSIRTIVRQEALNEDQFDIEMKNVEIDIGKISSSAKSLSNLIAKLNNKLRDMNVNEISGFDTKVVMQNFTELGLSIGTMVQYMGIEINNQKQIKNEN